MIRINNVDYNGKSITITNGKVIIDGVDQTPDSKEINILVDGNIDRLNVDNCDMLVVKGDCDHVKTSSGDVEVEGDVTNSINTMSGDVHCGNVGGSVRTMSGDIKHIRYQ